MDWKAMLNQILDGGYNGWLDVDVWENPDPFGDSAPANGHWMSSWPAGVTFLRISNPRSQ